MAHWPGCDRAALPVGLDLRHGEGAGASAAAAVMELEAGGQHQQAWALSDLICFAALFHL